MMNATGMPFIAPADSAQAVATVYTASLLITLPIVLAAFVAFVLRHASAQGRVLVWRSAIVALLVVFVGRQLPQHWVAWIVPDTLATPLIVLGRVQVTSGADGGDGRALVSGFYFAYLLGASLVIARLVIASFRMWRVARRARPLVNRDWRRALDDARSALGIARTVRLLSSDDVAVPMTWGVVHPIVVIPAVADDWNSEQRRIVLLHELAHIRSADWLFNLAGRAICALFWFHPGAWWIARGLRDDCELACDDRVIASGVQRSDYAELLIDAAERFLPMEPALALSRKRGLRARLAAVLDVRHDVAPIARGWAMVAVLGTTVVAGPMSAVRLAPTRSVLTTLMNDARWESRAYAVIGLAKRTDSVAVARTAAERDPSPRVRAWARYALGQPADAAGLRSILHE